MPATYSIFKGELTESTRKTDIYSVLQDLPNNSQKLISPREIRDSFLSTWANSAFKLTSVGGNEYIGLDSNNPSDRDIKLKILLGKRNVGGIDVMSDSLINSSDADIFFYNTKPENLDQNSTKITFLAGTSSNLFTNAPFIEAKKENDNIVLNIENPQSSINIVSSNGRVSINNINFPTVSDTALNASDGKILKYQGTYPFGNLQWSDVTINNIQVGSTDSTTNIYGSPVFLNGYNLEFLEDRIVPKTIGGIKQGASFSMSSFNGQNWPITEVLRLLIYPYIEPDLRLSVINLNTGNKYAEVGKPANLFFNYSITTYARESSEYVSKYFLRDNGTASLLWNVISPVGGILSGTPGTTFSFTQNYSENNSGAINEVKEYAIMASTINPANILNPIVSNFGFSFSAVDTIEYLAPFLINFSPTLYTPDPSGMSNLLIDTQTNKIVEPYGGTGSSIEYHLNSVNSYIYFAYPSNYPELTIIRDPNGFIIHDFNNISLSSFSISNNIVPQLPLNNYGPYRLYRTLLPVTYIGPGNFEFIF
jgi:hypothetical protein